MNKIILTLMLLFAANFAQANDAKLSWDNATVFAPQSNDPIKITDIKTAQPLPVVVYLHGCTGIVDWHDYDWGRTLSNNGYIVVMPNSMAREGRIANCDPVLKRGGLFPKAHEYRQNEIEYAIAQLQTSPWANKDKIFLVGHSEGGTAVAITQHAGTKANVILAWTCTFTFEPTLDGIKSPKDVPILAVAATRDEWRVGKPTYGRCVDRADGRKVTQVDLKGSTHATTKYPESKPAVLEFLKQF
jgi:dienelactone hydrolase